MATGLARPFSPETSIDSDHSEGKEITVQPISSQPTKHERTYVTDKETRERNSKAQAGCRARGKKLKEDLQAENEVLRASYGILQTELKALQAEKELLRAELHAKIQELQAENDALRSPFAQHLQGEPLAMYNRKRKALDDEIEEGEKAFSVETEKRQNALRNEHSRKRRMLEDECRTLSLTIQAEEAAKTQDDKLRQVEAYLCQVQGDLKSMLATREDGGGRAGEGL